MPIFFVHLPSSSVDRANRGMASRLCVLLTTRGLTARSGWDELDEVRGRRLKKKIKKNQTRIQNAGK